MMHNQHPIIIQGGMGVAVSSWLLAKAVALAGQLGVVSGTALDTVMVRRLQLGDPGGALRRAFNEFPLPEIAQRVHDRYFSPGGKAKDIPFVATKLLTEAPTQEQLELIVLANFAEVFLAKEDHEGLVGINYLEKIQLPALPSLFGAMLAGVDYVLMGAGIPTSIPGVIDRLCDGKPVELALKVAGAERDDHFSTRFDPEAFTGGQVPWLRRPKFLPIVASATLAAMLARKSSGTVDGFVVEGPTAGGHNAPPRGKTQLNELGEPIYSDRDEVDMNAMKELGLPFWLAGSYGSPEQVVAAMEAGATGVQVGTAFAFCEESGMREDLRREVVQLSKSGKLEVRTDPVASPAGFPFKVLSLLGSVSDSAHYQLRKRVCDLGFLRQGFKKADGTLGWRCPAEPVAAYVHKDGIAEDTMNRKCVCNGLMANVGLGQVRGAGEHELPLVTCGDDARNLSQFLIDPEAVKYTAHEVVNYLLSLVAIRNPVTALASH
ncbi:nitronate monooxygenase [Bythopirellula polymerisocia]|uniref:Nitronate monooxygenase n=1 Tax=Bythopirellula polymerisocia TaxID=2528003 RepID=A0A5C6CEP8_9BACT|nr:nitronate monooxygenase [Bythopirellula polymerisocia]TWU21776.1 Nitronate monooxygenase [Bythopirellula polymerisocia]